MDKYNELMELDRIYRNKRLEIIEDIVRNELIGGQLDKEIYLRNLKGEEWSTIVIELGMRNSQPIPNAIKRVSHQLNEWLKEKEKI